MICPVCHMENGSDVNFCLGCGRRIPRCPTCGRELTNRDRFCLNDGTRLSDDLLLLVPEETVLQAPVWTQTREEQPVEPVWEDSELFLEGTLRAGAFDPQETEEGTVSVTPDYVSPGWNAPEPPAWEPPEIPVQQPPQRAYCEGCGRPVPMGTRRCADCAGSGGKKGRGKAILIAVLAVLLVVAIAGGIHAIVHSDLFDWESGKSSTHTRKDDDDGDEDENIVTVDTAAATVATAAADTQPATESAAQPPATEATEPATQPPEPTAKTPDVPEALLYWIENCDKRTLTKEDLAGFDDEMCVCARNACYAKSGRRFSSPEIQEFFEQFDWYDPRVDPADFSADMLNAYQVANINVVLAYERAHGFES